MGGYPTAGQAAATPLQIDRRRAAVRGPMGYSRRMDASKGTASMTANASIIRTFARFITRQNIKVMPRHLRPWAQAMAHEEACIEDDREALFYSLGCLAACTFEYGRSKIGEKISLDQIGGFMTKLAQKAGYLGAAAMFGLATIFFGAIASYRLAWREPLRIGNFNHILNDVMGVWSHVALIGIVVLAAALTRLSLRQFQRA